jgi:hypothetical protein
MTRETFRAVVMLAAVLVFLVIWWWGLTSFGG